MRRGPTRLLTLAVASVAPAVAWAHGGDAVPGAAPGWTWDGWITGPLAVALLLYAVGFLRLRSRTTNGAAGLNLRGLLYLAGWLVLGFALVSPLHQLGERSFAAHMFEHELLMLAAAPLLVASLPIGPMLWALPAEARRGLGRLGHAGWFSKAWRALSDPIFATLLQAAALWLWHAPALFDLALASEGWHTAQHLSFLVSALLFWSAMLDPRRRARGFGLAAVCLFATSVVSGALGALMAFSQSPWYARYEALGLAPFGLTPTEDQQLAGLLMWIPGGLVHAAAALVLLGRALVAAPRSTASPPSAGGTVAACAE